MMRLRAKAVGSGDVLSPGLVCPLLLPGVRQLTAMTLLAEIGDIRRFPTARKLCAWAGLTPTVRNSDRKVRPPRAHQQGRAAVGALDSERGLTACQT
jgi:transposase